MTEPKTDAPRGTDATAANQALSGLREIGEYASHYLTAKVDLARLEVRTIARRAAVAACLAPIAIGVILIAVVFMVRGLAGLLGDVLGARPAIGDLLAGSIIVGMFVLAAVAQGCASRRRDLARVRARYEARRASQLSRFGRSVGHDADADRGRTDDHSAEPRHA